MPSCPPSRLCTLALLLACTGAAAGQTGPPWDLTNTRWRSRDSVFARPMVFVSGRPGAPCKLACQSVNGELDVKYVGDFDGQKLHLRRTDTDALSGQFQVVWASVSPGAGRITGGARDVVAVGPSTRTTRFELDRVGDAPLAFRPAAPGPAKAAAAAGPMDLRRTGAVALFVLASVLGLRVALGWRRRR